MLLNNFEITFILYDAEADQIFIHREPLHKIGVEYHETEGIKKFKGSIEIQNVAKNTHLLGIL